MASFGRKWSPGPSPEGPWFPGGSSRSGGAPAAAHELRFGVLVLPEGSGVSAVTLALGSCA